MLYVLEGFQTHSDLKSQISDLNRKSENISKQLYGWVETLKNSDIKGQRYLNKKVKASLTVEQNRRNCPDNLQLLIQSDQNNPTNPAI